MTSPLRLEDYNVSPKNGFLPTEPPLQHLPDDYYEPWEYIVKNLQGFILSKRLRNIVDILPVLSVDKLQGEREWRRAYCALAFISHAYIWGDKQPAERVPPPISIPFLAVCKHLELPPVATFAGVCLWNWKPIFDDEQIDTLSNLDTIDTFTGSIDEKWFYLVSVAIEAKGGPLIPLLLNATQAADRDDRETVIDALRTFAERLDDIGNTLDRMYDDCDPHVFYHRIRPFLAGSKNMADAGLPNGVIFDNGGPMHKQRYVQFSGGSNAQSSLIQFFDLILSIEHRPTGDKKPKPSTTTDPSIKEVRSAKKKSPQPSGFHQEMRKYMPGQHARFLSRVADIANLRTYVHDHPYDHDLGVAFDACVAMLTALRDKHIQIVSRYIIVKSREASSKQQLDGIKKSKTEINLAAAATRKKAGDGKEGGETCLKGTGGSSLIPFLRQARDETTEPAVAAWAQRLLAQRGRMKTKNPATAAAAREDGEVELLRKAETNEMWKLENGAGGLCIN